MKRVTGIGGIFFSARDPVALRSWYMTHLGIDVHLHRIAHEIPDARVEAIPGAGHCPPLEQPDATAEAILRHLARAAR